MGCRTMKGHQSFPYVRGVWPFPTSQDVCPELLCGPLYFLGIPILFSILCFVVGKPQQKLTAGGTNIPADSWEDSGEGHEQSGNLDWLAVPTECCQTLGQGIYPLTLWSPVPSLALSGADLWGWEAPSPKGRGIWHPAYTCMLVYGFTFPCVGPTKNLTF